MAPLPRQQVLVVQELFLVDDLGVVERQLLLVHLDGQRARRSAGQGLEESAGEGPVANPTASTAPATGKPAVAASESKSDVPAASGASAPASTPEAVLARTRDEVAKLATRLSGWEFEIPSWNYDSIFAR